jgi:ABC-type antimicrobial peptide transport system permease subunit
VLWFILREGLIVISLGLAAGLAVAIAVMPRRRAGSFLGLGSVTANPLALASVILVLVSAGLAACLFPARQALQLDPVVALRAE